jgi:hypothetical protein
MPTRSGTPRAKRASQRSWASGMSSLAAWTCGAEQQAHVTRQRSLRARRDRKTCEPYSHLAGTRPAIVGRSSSASLVTSRRWLRSSHRQTRSSDRLLCATEWAGVGVDLGLRAAVRRLRRPAERPRPSTRTRCIGTAFACVWSRGGGAQGPWLSLCATRSGPHEAMRRSAAIVELKHFRLAGSGFGTTTRRRSTRRRRDGSRDMRRRGAGSGWSRASQVAIPRWPGDGDVRNALRNGLHAKH